MNALIRLAVVVAVVLPLTVLGCFGLRFACNPEELRSLLREARHAEELQQAQQASLRRLEAREQLVREVIAQRCSLKEAVARLQELDGELDRKQPDLSPKPAERLYRYITLRVKEIYLPAWPEEAAAILRRLEKDYQQLQTSTQTPSTAPMARTEPSR